MKRGMEGRREGEWEGWRKGEDERERKEGDDDLVEINIVHQVC